MNIQEFIKDLKKFFTNAVTEDPDITKANEFGAISINGRIAFSICCLNNAIKKFNYQTLNWEFVFEKLWSCTSASYRDECFEMLCEIIPGDVLVDVFNEKDYAHITKENFDELKVLYLQINSQTLELINLIQSMVSGEVYGATGMHSLYELKELLKIMRQNDIQLPEISQFRKFGFETQTFYIYDYPVKQTNWWGKNFSKEEVNC